MSETLYAILHMTLFPGGLFALTLGLFYKALDRRVEARLQRRVGPPLIQPWLDIAKLCTKETLIPRTACKSVFLAAPVVGFAGMAVCAAFIPVPGVFGGLYNMGDLLVLFYLLPIPAIAMMLGGSASSSPFGAVGFSREMLLMLAYEMPLLMILLAVAALQMTGILDAAAAFLDEKVHNIYLINLFIGLLSAVVDNVPLVAGAMGMYPIAEASAVAASPDAAYLSHFVQDGAFWEFLAYCAGVGGSILIIGSVAGVVIMGIEKISFIWYVRNISLMALLGYLAGAGAYVVQNLLIG